MIPTPFRQPSAIIPMAMSGAALTLLAGLWLAGNLVPQPDEGAGAHIWQLLMAGQVPVIAWFAVKWLPRSPGPALLVLLLQFVLALVACAPVYLLKL